VVDGPVGADGIPDAVQDPGDEDSGIVNFTLADSEEIPDGTADFLELDADGDGCTDVLEAGFTDGDNNGLLGSGTFGAGLTVDANGVVTSGSDGYTGTNFTVIDFTTAAGCINAVNDANTVTIGEVTGGTAIADILANDTVLGAQATLGNVNLTVVTPSANPGVVLNTGTGAVTVAANTPSGTYVITYQICDAANPGSCDTAMIFVIVSPDTDGDGIPDITDLDDDNDGITDIEELDCTAPSNVLDWDVATFTGDIEADPVPGGAPNVASTVINGNTVTVSSSITTGVTTDFIATTGTVINGFSGLQTQARIRDLNNGETITYVFSFSEAVNNLNFSIVDIDQSVNETIFALFQDQVTVTATNNGVPVDLDFSLGSAVQNTSGNIFEGTSFVPTIPPVGVPVNADGNLNLNFLSGVDTVTVTYTNLEVSTSPDFTTIRF